MLADHGHAPRGTRQRPASTSGWETGNLLDGWTAALLALMAQLQPGDSWKPGDVSGAVIALAKEQPEGVVSANGGRNSGSLFTTLAPSRGSSALSERVSHAAMTLRTAIFCPESDALISSKQIRGQAAPRLEFWGVFYRSNTPVDPLC
ncbi:hypothetical protein [Dictyobacter formicarum]|uniref:Uncharacterized protein n=1 Tax=Dictyobacter formicarum TaxID=2778368 RepID=A0ABQ3VP84_9CHLR|nr:hypothetical protein [Dictyobacter formicarum]GHO87183.1 hypothetical protein KSZ_51890 [Dictyobacter formicarum]